MVTRSAAVAAAAAAFSAGLAHDLNPLFPDVEFHILTRQGPTEKIPPSFSEMSSGVVTRQKGI